MEFFLRANGQPNMAKTIAENLAASDAWMAVAPEQVS